MTLLYRVVPAHIYISLCVASWSLIASLQALAGSFSSMFILRAMLGVAEAAFSPGIPFLLYFFFKRDELAVRVGLFISAAALATSFAGSLAWLITKIGDRVAMEKWRSLFLIEGFPGIIVAVVAWYQIPDSPDTARYLSRYERKIARLRLRGEEREEIKTTGDKSKLDWGEIHKALTDRRCWITALMFFSCNVAFSSLPPFLPTIILDHSALVSQALSAPPYLLAFVSVLLTAHSSDRTRTRAPYILFHALLAALSYCLLSILGYLRAPFTYRYAAVYPAVVGFFSAITLILTWTLKNQNGDEKRGTGVVMLNLIGQFGPLVGTRLYPDSDGPFHVRGMAVCGGFMLLVAGLAWWLKGILARENRRGGQGEEGAMEEESLVDGDVREKKARWVNVL